MRVLNLLVIFVVGLFLAASAFAGDQAGQASSVGPPGAESRYPAFNEVFREFSSVPRDSGYDLIHPQEIHPNFSDPELVHPYGRRPRMNRDEDTVCYTMRSYLMAREAPDSDVTWPAGYSTCQKASRFGVKDAVEPLKPESR